MYFFRIRVKVFDKACIYFPCIGQLINPLPSLPLSLSRSFSEAKQGGRGYDLSPRGGKIKGGYLTTQNAWFVLQ
jgi:hypothetical protein